MFQKNHVEQEDGGTTSNVHETIDTSSHVLVQNIQAPIETNVEVTEGVPTASLLETNLLQEWLEIHYHPHTRLLPRVPLCRLEAFEAARTIKDDAGLHGLYEKFKASWISFHTWRVHSIQM